MQRPSVNRVQLIRAFGEQAIEESARPVDIAAVGAGGDEFEVDAEARNEGDEAAKFLRILFRREAPAAPPRFIPDAPELDIERIFIAC